MNRKSRTLILIVLFCFILSCFLACSQEAKKERHWKRGEKYFLENKFREAVIEYKNVLQIDPNNAGAHHK
jgi:Tfp pilus assembly protein PilF